MDPITQRILQWLFLRGGREGRYWVPTTGKRNEGKIKETLRNKKVTITKKTKGEFSHQNPRKLNRTHLLQKKWGLGLASYVTTRCDSYKHIKTTLTLTTPKQILLHRCELLLWVVTFLKVGSSTWKEEGGGRGGESVPDLVGGGQGTNETKSGERHFIYHTE